MLNRTVQRFARSARRAAVVSLALALPARADAQAARVTGTVTDAETGAALANVQVFVQGTSAGALTNQNGVFVLENVAPGTRTLAAQRIGYQEARRAVTVAPGATTPLDLALAPAVLTLQGVVATGLIDPVQGVRAPIAVARVDRDLMPVVAAGSPIQNLQGRVPGLSVTRTSGQPGEGVSIMLRTPTTLRENAGAPLVVVDGVILGGSGVVSTTDLEAMDVESIEIIRGAAAASLYGSRAAAGVIAITTVRGAGLPLGQTRFNARTEYGVSQNLRRVDLNDSHHFLMDPTLSHYVDAEGRPVGRNQRVAPPLSVAFQDKPYPTPLYDNLAAITRPGRFVSNNFSVTGNSEATNFAVLLNHLEEHGSLRENEGYRRNALRVNLDHRFREALRLSVSMYHSRDGRDNIPTAAAVTATTANTQGNPFTDVLRGPRDVDFTRRDGSGRYLQQPDPLVVYQNPLWTQTTRENDQQGSRTLASVGLDWSPLPWLSASGSVGYDRGDTELRVYVPKGTPANVGQSGQNDGLIRFDNDFRDTWNAEAQATLRRGFGPLDVRTTFRGLMERDRLEEGTRFGENFILVGVPQLDNIRAEDRTASSSEEEIRASGYLWDTAFDYDGKYVFTVLGRRDGSSLFGPDNRWHGYYRVAGAWRVAEEPWFDVPGIDELKVSAARGTAGGRPSFAAQYETWVLNEGVPTKSTLGNRSLAPERTTENEISLNLVLRDRFGIVLTHAWQKTEGQLVQAPLPNYSGYSTQWVNGGTVEGRTTELEIEAQLVQRPELSWTSLVVADYSYAEITDWPIPCQTPPWRFNCAGEPVYGIYSWWLIKDHAGLNEHRGGEAVPYASQFEVNDEGFLVWVGEGNHYWEGFEKELWGTSSPRIGGRTYQWGHPIVEQDAAGNNVRQLLGEASPVSLGWLNNLRVRGVTLHAHLHAAIGGQANNRNHQLMTNTSTATAPRMDQAGKPEGLKKPIAYFRSANDGDASYYMEDASYLKLRTLSATYELTPTQLARFGLRAAGLDGVALGLVGRNLFTLTSYDGFDPEQALNLNTRINSDGGGYPPTRSLTAEVSVTF